MQTKIIIGIVVGIIIIIGLSAFASNITQTDETSNTTIDDELPPTDTGQEFILTLNDGITAKSNP